MPSNVWSDNTTEIILSDKILFREILYGEWIPGIFCPETFWAFNYGKRKKKLYATIRIYIVRDLNLGPSSLLPTYHNAIDRN